MVKVFISLKKGGVATEAEIKRFCRERLADYKVPNVARKAKIRVALSNSFGIGSTNATLILGEFPT